MPKLIGATTDVGKITQYLARKCVIHKPHAELDLSPEKQKTSPRFGTNADHFKGAEVHMLAERGQKDRDPNQFVAISPKGRAMKVTVEEIDPDTLDKDLFQKVASN